MSQGRLWVENDNPDLAHGRMYVGSVLPQSIISRVRDSCTLNIYEEECGSITDFVFIWRPTRSFSERIPKVTC
jgi:hypothetical protein